MGNPESGRPGRLRLLRTEDQSQPFVGWKSSSDGGGSLVNQKGWAALRVVVQLLREGCYQDAYDQVVLIENPGAIVACLLDGRVGLVQNFRFVGRRLYEAGADYVRSLDEQGRLEELVDSLGEWQWELPRGLAPHSFDGLDLERFVIATAKAEALEESGLTIRNARLLGKVNVNTTFFAHPQYAVGADVVSIGDNRPEAMEILGKTHLFGPAEIRRMADNGELTDGLTLATLALVGFHF